MDTETRRGGGIVARRGREIETDRLSGDGRRPALRDISVRLVPDEIEMAVGPEVQEGGPVPLCPLWHYVHRYPSLDVFVQSRLDHVQVVSLSTRSIVPGWNDRWTRWLTPVRRVSESEGGAAAAAQDVLSEDSSTLNILLREGEERRVTLEFHTVMDGRTYPGDYSFDILVTGIDDGAITMTPGLLRLRHPPATFLNFLPAIYTQLPETPRGRFERYEDPPFFERYLRGFEDATEPMQTLLANMYHYFDPDDAPADFLPWLATWVALVLDENWPELKRRRLIREAVELYRWRGTRHGLSRYLEIYTGVIPQINDQPYEGMRLGSASLLGRDTLLGGVPRHSFVITLAVPENLTINEQVVRDIIESEKPAHTAYDLRIVSRVTGED